MAEMPQSMGEIPQSIGEVPQSMGEMPPINEKDAPNQYVRCLQLMGEKLPING